MSVDCETYIGFWKWTKLNFKDKQLRGCLILLHFAPNPKTASVSPRITDNLKKQLKNLKISCQIRKIPFNIPKCDENPKIVSKYDLKSVENLAENLTFTKYFCRDFEILKILVHYASK